MNEYFMHSNYDCNCYKNDAKLHKNINYVQIYENRMVCFFTLSTCEKHKYVIFSCFLQLNKGKNIYNKY